MNELDKARLIGRINTNRAILGGKPIVRNMRFSVEQVLYMLGSGMLPKQIIGAFPFLEEEDIQACILFANKLVKEEAFLEVQL